VQLLRADLGFVKKQSFLSSNPLTPDPSVAAATEGRSDSILVALAPKRERGELIRFLLPSPPWGRGWTAAGVFFSRGGPGEGVAIRKRTYEMLH
jgi:hypothetical protein